MQDPSKDNFCPYLTGSKKFTAAPPESVCQVFDLINPRSQCQTNFCLLGTEGYFDFVLNVVAFLREYATWIGAGFSVLVLFQMVLIVNVHNLAGGIKLRRLRRRQVGIDDDSVSQKSVTGSVSMSPRHAPDEMTPVRSFSGGGELSDHNPHIPAA